MKKNFALLVLSLSAGVAVAQPTVEFLGVLPGITPYSEAFGISDDGSVVTGRSGSSFYYGSSWHGYHWSHSSGMTDLDELAPIGTGWAVSGDGNTIVGFEASTGGSHAYSFADGLASSVYSHGSLFGVSRDGTVFVGYESDSHGISHDACRAVSGSSRRQIISDSSALTSEARATSADGSVVVGWANLVGLGRRAFVWNETDGMVNIGSASAGGSSEALSVSQDGSVIVGDSASGSQFPRATVWTMTPNLVQSTALVPDPYSVAYAVSADGSTIAGVRGASPYLARHGWIYRQDIGVQDVQTVLATVLPAGWTVNEIRAVNANGQYIAGSATNSVGHIEAFVAHVPSCVETAIARQTGDVTVPANSAATFSVSPGGFGPFTFQWSRNGGILPGATGATLTVSASTSADAGVFSCTVAGRCGSATSADARLIITGLCPSDFNNDGFADFFDYDAFVECYETGSCPQGASADFNGDGFVDFFDYDDFVLAFETGC